MAVMEVAMEVTMVDMEAMEKAMAEDMDMEAVDMGDMEVATIKDVLCAVTINHFIKLYLRRFVISCI